MEKPNNLKEEHLKFLDNLREEGITNMFGAAPYLKAVYPKLIDKNAVEILQYWMKTFNERHSIGVKNGNNM